MSTITVPKRITFTFDEVAELVREAAIKKCPELQDEEFEVQLLQDGAYSIEATAVVAVVV